MIQGRIMLSYTRVCVVHALTIETFRDGTCRFRLRGGGLDRMLLLGTVIFITWLTLCRYCTTDLFTDTSMG